METSKIRGAITLTASGVAHVESGATMEVPWSMVFGAVTLGKSAYILCERPPPLPPWICVTASEASAELQALVESVRARVQERGYRQTKHGPMPLRELEMKVLQGEHIPGALEVPIGPGPGRLARVAQGATMAGAGATILGLMGGVAVGAIAALGALGVTIVLPHVRRRGSKHGRRVLVLTPHGCVIGLPTGARAFGYDELGAFELVGRGTHSRKATDLDRASLKILDASGGTLGVLDGRWFGAPLPLIVAVAESYRRRHLA